MGRCNELFADGDDDLFFGCLSMIRVLGDESDPRRDLGSDQRIRCQCDPC